MWTLKTITGSETMDERIAQLQRREIRPTTPGEFLREDVLPELGISQDAFAQKLGVSRRTISEVLLEKRPVSTDMAWRLGKLLGNGPGLWLNMQRHVDLWDALHVDASKYDEIEPLRKTGSR